MKNTVTNSVSVENLDKENAPFFTVTHANEDGTRTGLLSTCHGFSETPCFLPIASYGDLRAISFEQAAECGTRVVMANAWHIFREAGEEKLLQLGGVHRLIGWDGMLFTDSGGYQVFSLRDEMEITDDGVLFGVEDGALNAERVIRIQKTLGSDIMFVLDDCAPFPCERKRAEEAVRRTSLWATQSMAVHNQTPKCYEHDQWLYGIIQGSTIPELRQQSIDEVASLGFDGYGIGGLSIGMPRSAIRDMTLLTCELLPDDHPRHLLGVGLPGQILDGVADGTDTFDCVLPIRKAQRGIVHTSVGEVRYKLLQPSGKKDLPLDPNCDCKTCRTYTREELRLLFREDKAYAGEVATIHNLTFYHQVLKDARTAIRENRFDSFRSDFHDQWNDG